MPYSSLLKTANLIMWLYLLYSKTDFGFLGLLKADTFIIWFYLLYTKTDFGFLGKSLF